jgi:dTDP-4-dehydrorhamnose reductase
MTSKSRNCIPELWGGIECSFNRVGESYFDQFELCGHYQRGEADIECIAALGIKKLRYPILWEYHQPYVNTEIDWSWTSQQLKAIEKNNITPIVGLLHHGSGPAFTNLYDENFSKQFSSYAANVARKFSQLQYYTPINEPLTTARFSGLYGLWYPHYKDDYSFAVMFLNQLKATVLAMQEIRKINPEAKLVQTEDLGKTYSTPLLQYQADFENERRWLTFDFLCGKFDEHHALWNYFIDIGIPERDLLFFSENPCPPDIIGINHYLTSERYLDENLSIYPPHMHGGNNVHAYADIEAIRVKHDKLHGLFWLLLETWTRYERPIAITEVHLHCTREEQLRWLKEKLDIAALCVNQNIPLEAVTVWSLFGAYGWNKLLTGLPFTYESGVFDLSYGDVRPTALVELMKSYAVGKSYHHPLLEQPSWWTRSDRYLREEDRHEVTLNNSSKPIFLLTNEENIFLTACIHHYCKLRGILTHIIQFDSESETSANLVKVYHPWAVVICEIMNEELATKEIGILSTLFQEKNEHPLKLATFVQPWFELSENLQNLYCKPLLIRSDLYENAEYEQIESSFKCDPSSLQNILTSFPYIGEFINASLNLLIDDCAGVWELSKNSEVIIQDFVQENIFD